MPPPRKKETIPDAWDDDWEPDAGGGGAPLDDPRKPESPPLTKAEALARHEESNRKLWQSADSNSELQYLPATNDVVPAPAAFKPPMKVLSRRPQAGSNVMNDDDAASRAAAQPSPEEIRLRQQRDLEEKQRKYDEARAKIFGEPVRSSQQQQQLQQSGGYHNHNHTSSGVSTPGTVTPPQQSEMFGRPNQRGRGRGRGGGGGGGYRGGGASDRGANSNSGSGYGGGDDVRRPPAQPSTRELYDPNSSSPRPGSGSSSFSAQRRTGGGGGGGGDASSSSPRSGTPREEDQVIRAPRGPDSNGRGGFGFVRRGGGDPTKNG